MKLSEIAKLLQNIAIVAYYETMTHIDIIMKLRKRRKDKDEKKRSRSN